MAKIFLGDAGSVPLGYVLGFLLLELAVRGWWRAALILPLYFLVDASLTLLRRLLRGERVWQAHREHFYQQAVQCGLGHDGGAADDRRRRHPDRLRSAAESGWRTRSMSADPTPARTSAASAICGTHLGLTIDVASTRGTPASRAARTRRTLTSVDTGSGQFWKPSRGPTSMKLTRSAGLTCP